MDRLTLIRGGKGGPPPRDPDDPGPGDEDMPSLGAKKGKKLSRKDDERCTEQANSEIFYERHGGDLRFCFERGAWLVWVGDHWSWSRAQQQLEERTADVARDQLNEVLSDPTLPREVVTWAKKSTSMAGRMAMANGCRHRLAVDIEELDADPTMTNTASGVVDLRTGDAREHRREDLMTRISPVHYDPGAQAPKWRVFIDEITGGDADLADFLQRAAGYSITGDMSEQVFFVCVGTGSNGKGVFLRSIKGAIGDYARTISASFFVETPHNKRPEIAELLGVRLAIASEPEGDKRMDEALVKAVSGGDEMMGERKYEAPFTFRPICKLWLACNAVPGFQSGGFSMMRRLIVIPFRQTFSGARANLHLEDELEAERPGILRWLVDGCLEWQRRGLEMPKAVLDAIAEAQGDMDPLAAWWDECVVQTNPAIRTSVTDLHQSYRAWAEAAGQKPRRMEAFRRLIKGRGLELVTLERRLHVVGYGLLSERPGQQSMYDE